MISIEKYKQEYEIRAIQMKYTKKTVGLSWIRFENGLTDSLEI